MFKIVTLIKMNFKNYINSLPKIQKMTVKQIAQPKNFLKQKAN